MLVGNDSCHLVPNGLHHQIHSVVLVVMNNFYKCCAPELKYPALRLRKLGYLNPFPTYRLKHKKVFHTFHET